MAGAHGSEAAKRRAADQKKYWRRRKQVIARVVRRQRERYHQDPAYMTQRRLRCRIAYAVRAGRCGKASNSTDLIGCDAHQLVAHIESLFLEGMCWSNKHLWHIDHIIPVSAFDLSTKEGQQAAFHYTNLRPLWATDNHRKSSKPPALQRRFGFGYVMLADRQKSRGTRGAASDSQGKETCG